MTEPNPIDQAPSSGWLYLIAVASVAYLSAIWFKPAFLLGTPEYVWPVLHHGNLSMILPVSVLLFCGAWLAIIFYRQVRDADMPTSRIVAVLIMLGLLTQISAASLHGMGHVELPLRVYLPDHTSYFTDAVKVDDFREFSGNYDRNLRGLATHSRTHPPGAIAFFHVVNKTVSKWPGFVKAYNRTIPRSAEAQSKFGLDAAQVAGGSVAALLLLLAAIIVVPLSYLLGREFMGREAAFLGAVLFSLTPAFSHKTPVMDHAFGLFIILAMLLWVRSLRGSSRSGSVLAGSLIGFGLWFSPTFLAAFPLAFALGLAAGFSDHKPQEKISIVLPRLLLPLILFAVACGLALAAGRAVFGVSFLEVYKAITEVGWYINNTVSGRVHSWMWILFNPYEFFIWQGMPVLLLVAAAGLSQVRCLVRRDFAGLDWFVVWVLLFGIALDVSGRVCYESSRLTWFLMPLTCLIAGRELIRIINTQSARALWLIFLLTAGSTLVFRLIF